MSTPITVNFITEFFDELNKLLTNFVYNGYHALATYLQVPLALAATLYIVIMGISITQGWLNLSMSNLVKSAVTLGLIYTLTLNWDFFSYYVVHFIQDSAQDLGDVIINANKLPMLNTAGPGIHGALQSALDQYINFAHTLFTLGSIRHPEAWFCALIVLGVGYFMVAIALFEMVLADIMLAILFTAAPIIVPLAFFKFTRGMVDRWMGSILGFAFMLIFVSATLALVLSLTSWAMGDLINPPSHNSNASDWAVIVLITVVGSGLLISIAVVAKHIGGGVTVASGAALVTEAAQNSMQRLKKMKDRFNKPKDHKHPFNKGIRTGLREGT